MTQTVSAVLLAREGTEKHDGVSQFDQCQKARQLCKKRGWTIAGEFSDACPNGQDLRTSLERAVDKACELKGVLLTYTAAGLLGDGFSVLPLIERMIAADAHFATVADGIDTTEVPGGMSLILTILNMVDHEPEDADAEGNDV